MERTSAGSRHGISTSVAIMLRATTCLVMHTTMWHFATEVWQVESSNFYTSVDISRVMARIVSIGPKTQQDQDDLRPGLRSPFTAGSCGQQGRSSPSPLVSRDRGNAIVPSLNGLAARRSCTSRAGPRAGTQAAGLGNAHCRSPNTLDLSTPNSWAAVDPRRDSARER